jgi:hypothetical protein
MNDLEDLKVIDVSTLGRKSISPRPLDLRVGLAIHWAMCERGMPTSHEYRGTVERDVSPNFLASCCRRLEADRPSPRPTV